jgi:hypothetical protein
LFLFHFIFIFSPEKEEENVQKFYYFMTWWVMCVSVAWKCWRSEKKSKILLGCGKKNRVKTKIFACPEKIPSHPCPHLYWKNS